MMGVASITVQNRGSSDWTSVIVCVNDRWCADGHVGSEAGGRIAAGGQWKLNWFMEDSIALRDAVRAGRIPGRGTVSDFVDERGTQNTADLPIRSVTIEADQGSWARTY